jgi:hypothetical protein
MSNNLQTQYREMQRLIVGSQNCSGQRDATGDSVLQNAFHKLNQSMCIGQCLCSTLLIHGSLTTDSENMSSLCSRILTMVEESSTYWYLQVKH